MTLQDNPEVVSKARVPIFVKDHWYDDVAATASADITIMPP